MELSQVSLMGQHANGLKKYIIELLFSLILFTLVNFLWLEDKNWLFYVLSIYFSLSLSDDLTNLIWVLIKRDQILES